MGRITVRRPVVKLTLGAESTRRADTLAVEEPLEIRVGGTPLAVTMRTPGNDVELAAGFLTHEGIATPSSVHGIAYCTDVDLAPEQEFNVVTLTASAPVDLVHRHAGMSSGSSACGS